MSRESELFEKLLQFSDRYDISFQLWSGRYSIDIARDGVPLWDYGGSHEPAEVMEKALQYLKDVRKMRKKNR